MDIKVENLTHTYMPSTHFERTAVSDVSFEIKSGEFVGLIGHSGSGKSTLVQHLNALLKPTSGKVTIGGKDLSDKKTDLRQVRFEVGLVFQYPEQQLFEETVYEDIAFGPKNMNLSKDEIDHRVRSAAKIVGIGDKLLEKSPFELSGGQKRRAAIAGTLALYPKILILDEPTAGLDPKGRDSILRRIRELHDELHITVILVSHSMEDIAKNVDRLIVLNKGKIVMDDVARNVFLKADELEKIGLAAPFVTRVFKALNKRGIDIDPNVITVSEAKNLILEYLKKRGEHE